MSYKYVFLAKQIISSLSIFFKVLYKIYSPIKLDFKVKISGIIVFSDLLCVFECTEHEAEVVFMFGFLAL